MRILKFGAVWCVNCIVMNPVWEEIEAEMPELETVYYDADDNSEEFKKYDIGKDIPVLIFLDENGNELKRLKGAIGKEELLEIINHLAGDMV